MNVRILKDTINTKILGVLNPTSGFASKTWDEATETLDDATYTWDLTSGGGSSPYAKIGLSQDSVNIQKSIPYSKIGNSSLNVKIE